ncbi:MAG: guanylate kinase [Candidatus Pacebacteria bacterium]|nr:guanylate kinase [Candidatus Paceibacterota bacterium]MBP9715780.1 guanylate kinase [Candidatus Paceibacterota bacterium]
METNKPKAIIICAPSGAGKSTITSNVMSQSSNFSFSVSGTTRIKRPGEVDGKNYHFFSESEFKDKIARGDFVEYEEYCGNLYGTLKSEIERLHNEGKVIFFDVEVRGAASLKKYFGRDALVIFIYVPLDVLEQRLRLRNTETEESLRERLAIAKKEMLKIKDADVVIENIDLEKAINETKTAVIDFLSTSH